MPRTTPRPPTSSSARRRRRRCKPERKQNGRRIAAAPVPGSDLSVASAGGRAGAAETLALRRLLAGAGRSLGDPLDIPTRGVDRLAAALGRQPLALGLVARGVVGRGPRGLSL